MRTTALSASSRPRGRGRDYPVRVPSGSVVRVRWWREVTMIRSVVFDVGETLLDDTREFAAWADWIGIPRHTFSAVLGAVTAEGRNNAETFQYFRPGFDLATERGRREEAGVGEQ